MKRIYTLLTSSIYFYRWKSLFKAFGPVLLFIITLKSYAQAPLNCDNTLYIVNNGVLYDYTGTATPTAICTIAGPATAINALGFSTKGNILWAWDDVNGTVVTIDGACTKTSIPVTGLPNGDYNVGTVDEDGYFYIYDGTNGTRFYTIDTDPLRAATYGKLVNPSGGAVPYPVDTRGTKGTSVQGAGNRNFADWHAHGGYLYTILNENSTTGPFRIMSIKISDGTNSLVTGTISGDGIQQCPGAQSASFGAVFRANDGTFYVFQNCRGQLYKIVGTTATQVSTGAGFVTNNVDGALCPGQDPPSPVSFISFEARKNGNANKLSWSTANELGNKGFEVEQSTDAKTWNTIGFVGSSAPNGDSETELKYSFTDHSPSYGDNYYRLKQIDLDGKFEYSVMRVVVNENEGKVIVFPNPTSRYVTIAELNGDETINMYDITGRKIRSAISTSKTTDLTLEGLKEGIYHLQIIGKDGKVSTHKLVKSL
jgi:hypothetical protein